MCGVVCSRLMKARRIMTPLDLQTLLPTTIVTITLTHGPESVHVVIYSS